MTVELGTVSHRSAVLAQSLDDALEAFALGDCGRVDSVARCEDVGLDLVLDAVLGSVLKTELSQETSGFVDLSLAFASGNGLLLDAGLLTWTAS